MLPVIGILLGEAAGIGPEIIAKLCADRAYEGKCRPIIIGDKRVMLQGMKIAGVDFSLHAISSIAEAEYCHECVDFIDLKDLDISEYALGEISITSGRATYHAMEYALDLILEKKIDGLVYGPQNKTSFHLAGYALDSMDFIVQHLGVQGTYGELNILDNLWTTRVTSHIPLRNVVDKISTDSIFHTIVFADDSMKKSGIASPAIAVAGLNPHNGENGLCGTEEQIIIEPAVARARQQNINACGPFSADTVFIRAFNGEFDMVVTMYHDQGQIAMKLKDFSNIVTMIGGLDVPIATPAHGTAFDIVGKSVANMEPTKRALDLVCKIAINQKNVLHKGTSDDEV